MLSILLNGRAIGEAQLDNGILQAKCPMDSRYIYRLELVGAEVVPLGVMIPAEGAFTLRKSGITQAGLRYCEIKRCLPGESVASPLPFALSQGEDIGSLDFCTDELLRDCLRATKGVKSALYLNVRYVYFPLLTDAPCAMAPFFFWMTSFESKGKLYAAIKIADGMPCTV